MVYSQGFSTVLEMTKIGVFGLIYVSLVQVIGQARWSIPKSVLTAFAVTKIAVFGHVLLIFFLTHQITRLDSRLQTVIDCPNYKVI